LVSIRSRTCGKIISKEDLIKLLSSFVTDAFTQAMPIERSTATFKAEIKDVLDRVRESIEAIDLEFKPDVKEIVRHLEALCAESAKIRDTGRYSDYYNTGTRGIVVDALVDQYATAMNKIRAKK
jgi:hypothetical protein